MTLGHDDGLRVKRPSGISPPSIVRGGEDRPELFFLRSQVPPAEGMEPLAGLDACPGDASRLAGSRTPHVTRGCASTLMGRHSVSALGLKEGSGSIPE